MSGEDENTVSALIKELEIWHYQMTEEHRLLNWALGRLEQLHTEGLLDTHELIKVQEVYKERRAKYQQCCDRWSVAKHNFDSVAITPKVQRFLLKKKLKGELPKFLEIPTQPT